MGRRRLVDSKSTNFGDLLKVVYGTRVSSWLNSQPLFGPVDKEHYAESYKDFPNITDSFSPSVGGR